MPALPSERGPQSTPAPIPWACFDAMERSRAESNFCCNVYELRQSICQHLQHFGNGSSYLAGGLPVFCWPTGVSTNCDRWQLHAENRCAAQRLFTCRGVGFFAYLRRRRTATLGQTLKLLGARPIKVWLRALQPLSKAAASRLPASKAVCPSRSARSSPASAAPSVSHARAPAAR